MILTNEISCRPFARIAPAFVIGLAALIFAPSAAFGQRAHLSRGLTDRLADPSTTSINIIVQGPQAEIDRIASTYGVRVLKRMDMGAVVSGNPAQVRAVAGDSNVGSLTGDDVVISTMAASTQSTGADQLWRGADGTNFGGLVGSGVGVVVIDSGIGLHPDTDRRVRHRVDFVNDNLSSNPDVFGHGTHVASLIAGSGAGSRGKDGAAYIGMAPGAELVSLRVLGADGFGLVSDVVLALEWAIKNKDRYRLRVVNLSLGLATKEPYRTEPMALAVERAVAAGLVVVASAGNYGKLDDGTPIVGVVVSPGYTPGALTVGALNTRGTVERSDDAVATYSSRGPVGDPDDESTWELKPDLVAPGNAIIGAAVPDSYLWTRLADRQVIGASGGTYLTMSGASMSTAVVSGAVAQLLQAVPKLTPAQVKFILQFTAQRLEGFGLIEQGAGSVNVPLAVALAEAGDLADAPSSVLIGGEMVDAGELAFLGPRVVAADGISVWGNSKIWTGGRSPSGNGVVWGGKAQGSGVVWGGKAQGSGVVWGGKAQGSGVVWGGKAQGSGVVWGGKAQGNGVVWGGKAQGNGVVWGGKAQGSGVVWGGKAQGSGVVWGGKAQGNGVVWGGKAQGNGVVWGGKAQGSGVVWGGKAQGSGVVWGGKAQGSGVVWGGKAQGNGVVWGGKAQGNGVVWGGKAQGSGVVWGGKAQGSGVVWGGKAQGSGVVWGGKAQGSGVVWGGKAQGSGVVWGGKAQGNGVVWGGKAQGNGVVWGGKAQGNGVVWGGKAQGSGVVWGGKAQGSGVVWGGKAQGSGVVWGGKAQGSGVVWGGKAQGSGVVWGGKAQGSGVVWGGKAQGSGVVWGGKAQGSGVVWGGKAQGSGVVWGGKAQGSGVVWGGKAQGSGVVWGGKAQGSGVVWGGKAQGSGVVWGGKAQGSGNVFVTEGQIE